jgi:hypothetical protein
MPGYNDNLEHDIYTWHYDSGASLTEEQGDYHILTIELLRMQNHLIHDKNYVKLLIEDILGIDIKTLDVRSIFLLFNNRTSCHQINYAKNKTKEIFNMMVEKLSSYDAIVMLNLYLMINCIILDVDISKNFNECQKKFTLRTETEYEYDDYVEDTKNDRYQMIIDIKNEINNF